MKRICVKCGKEKDVEEFRLNAKAEGYIYRRPECMACEKEYGAERLKLSKLHKRPEIGAKCACCGKSDKRLILDHCHKTNVFRGFICQGCNLGIGRLGDSVEGVMNAVRYLKNFEELKAE